MKVLIVGSRGECSYAQMYREAGHTVVMTLDEAELVQFTGGSDVSPHLYGEKPHAATSFHNARDVEEQRIYDFAKDLGLPMVGICRGGQFLNVMNGGKMYQHVDNHAIHGTHEAVDKESGKIVQVTSTHHQMMRPTENAIILCVAHLAETRQSVSGSVVVDDGGICLRTNSADTEAVFYEDTKCLCFQPHPEFNRLAIGDTREYFFELLNRYIIGE